MEVEVAALEALDVRQEGIDPATKAALALEDAGVVGSLPDFMEAPGEVASVVETYLGPLAQALVVRDSSLHCSASALVSRLPLIDVGIPSCSFTLSVA